MKIPSMDTIINKGRTTVNKVRQYATRENYTTAKKEINNSLNNVAKDFKNSPIGKWVIKKVNAFSNIAKPYIDNFKNKITDNKLIKDIKDFSTEKYKNITENNYINKGINWIKDTYNNITEKPVIKNTISSIKNFFKQNKDVV